MIARLARLDASESWAEDVNPVQRSALEYLSHANRFSRSPSHVADFLGSTRGTVSQTLKSLAQKGYVAETPSEIDKRAITFDLTDKGAALVAQPRHLVAGLDAMSPEERDALASSLEATLKFLVLRNNGRPFGLCRNCKYFSRQKGEPFCRLLSETLTPPEADQICHEQDPK